MRIHEYQAKEILAREGVPVPRGRVAFTPSEARDTAADLGVPTVVKAQVHAGGRGKAGGIKLASSPAEAEAGAASLLGTRLVTHQTDREGAPVRGVLVEEQLRVVRELYLGLVVDGGAGGVVVMASEAGGMDIEEIAEATPERVLRISVDPMLGLQPFQGRAVAYGLDVKPGLVRSVAGMVSMLYSVFEGNECSLVEINPLVETEDGRVLAADAKISFEDDALFRHPELLELRDTEQEDPFEARARDIGVNYVRLDGEVGCLVNGAGLAMATMDVVGAAGTAPANFLDVGGSADEEKVAQALRIILSDSSVTRVLVNIFGGILRCDVVARGILAAAGGMPNSMPPIVARLRGTNVEEGREVLAGSGLDVTLVDNLAEAADAIKKAGRRG